MLIEQNRIEVCNDGQALQSCSVFDGRKLITAGKLWGDRWDGSVHVLDGERARKTSLAVAAACGLWLEKTLFVLGKDNGQIECFRCVDEIVISKSVQHIEHESPIISISGENVGGNFATGCMQGSVVYWDAGELVPIRHIVDLGNFKTTSRSCRIMLKDNLLLCGINSIVKLLDVRCNSATVKRWTTAFGDVQDLILTGTHVYLAERHGSVASFDLRTDECHRCTVRQTPVCLHAAFHDDGIFVGCAFGHILWLDKVLQEKASVSQDSCVSAITRHEDNVLSTAYDGFLRVYSYTGE